MIGLQETKSLAPRRASGVAWFGEIPQHWRCEHLKRFTKRIQAGMTPPTNTPEYYCDGTIPWFSPGSFNGDIDLREPRKLINELARSEDDLRIFPGETVFLVGIGATIGNVGLVSAEASCNQQLIGIVCGHQMHSRFLAYQFKIYEDVIPGIATMTTLPIFDQVETGYLPTLQPPFEDQQRIAVYLDASCAAIDAAVAAKRRQLETLDQLRKSTIHGTVTRGLNPTEHYRTSNIGWFGDIPQHWHCEHLKRLATRIQTGVTPPTDNPDYYLDGTIPWFSPGSYNGDIELREPRKLINELARKEGALRIFPGGTVFLVGIGATIGKVGLVPMEASCNQQIIGIVCGHRMNSRYLAYQFKIYEDIIPGIASATTLPIFDQVKTGYLPTLQPPLDEQEAISAYLDMKLDEIRNIVNNIEAQINTLTAYRKSLIHECVTGQRRITEADVARLGGGMYSPNTSEPSHGLAGEI